MLKSTTSTYVSPPRQCQPAIHSFAEFHPTRQLVALLLNLILYGIITQPPSIIINHPKASTRKTLSSIDSIFSILPSYKLLILILNPSSSAFKSSYVTMCIILISYRLRIFHIFTHAIHMRQQNYQISPSLIILTNIKIITCSSHLTSNCLVPNHQHLHKRT